MLLSDMITLIKIYKKVSMWPCVFVSTLLVKYLLKIKVQINSYHIVNIKSIWTEDLLIIKYKLKATQ